MNNEIWKPVKGYEGFYEVSNLGRVKSLDRIDSLGRNHKGIILRPNHNRHGYEYVCLRKNGNKKFKNIHRIVAEAFIENPSELPQVNHKDEDKTNNRVDNLEWCTAKYNMNYGDRNKKAGLSLRGANAKITEDDVREIRTLSKKGVTQDVLAEMFGISQTQVGRIIRYERWGWLS